MYTEEKLVNKSFIKQGTATGGVLPLSTFSSGNSGIVYSVKGKGDTKRFLENLGFVENAEITIVSKVGGSVIVNVKGSKVAISKALATKIMAAPA
ncbi:MAG: FeoA family protein [Bacillota bacterium]|nr:FeoA family protein [Bacillota bacterium]